MRILVVAPGPNFSVADVQHGWERALIRQGHQVRTYNLNERLSTFSAAKFGEDDQQLSVEDAVRLAMEPLGNAIWRWWPDVIFIISGFFIDNDLWEVLKQRPHKTVLLCTESPYEDVRQFEQMCVGEPDMVLLNDPANIERFRAQHPNVWYAPHAYDPFVHTPGRKIKKYACDFGFVGTGYKSRLDFLARVDWRDVDMKLGGMWQGAENTCLERYLIHEPKECLDNSETVKLYRSAKVSANLYRARTGTNESSGDARLAKGWAIGPREVELAATRTFFLREPRPEGDELFPFLPAFTEPDEFSELLRYYLKHDREREDAARRAQEAIKDRTFDAHARQLMQHLPD
jgi:hypothetical protein